MKKKINISGFLNKPWVKNIVSPLIRGAVQTLPGGGIAVQAMRNITHEMNPVKEGEPPHNYLSIAVQIAGIVAILWAFYTKSITIEQVLSLVGFAG